MTKELKQEYTLRISQANKTQMVVLIYEMLLTYLDDVKVELHRENYGESREYIQKAKNCVDELVESLNLEFEIARNLMPLYTYVKKELIRAEIARKEEYVDHCIPIIKELHQAYLEVSKQDDSAPVMGNSQTVFAGLTYSKGSLCESRNDGIGSRGYLV